jgi:hypothetical protein
MGSDHSVMPVRFDEDEAVIDAVRGDDDIAQRDGYALFLSANPLRPADSEEARSLGTSLSPARAEASRSSSAGLLAPVRSSARTMPLDMSSVYLPNSSLIKGRPANLIFSVSGRKKNNEISAGHRPRPARAGVRLVFLYRLYRSVFNVSRSTGRTRRSLGRRTVSLLLMIRSKSRTLTLSVPRATSKECFFSSSKLMSPCMVRTISNSFTPSPANA